jgi:uncharacterized OsmC-like protein
MDRVESHHAAVPVGWDNSMSGKPSVLVQKQEILASRPDKIEARIEVESGHVSALRSEARVRDFTVAVDMPESFGGTNSAPRPGEMVLAALGACIEITYRLHAEYMGIVIDGIRTRVTGVTDARGFLPDSDGVRPGFQKVDVTVLIDSPAGEEDLERLRRAVDVHCPVLDDLRSPIPVEVDVDKFP